MNPSFITLLFLITITRGLVSPLLAQAEKEIKLQWKIAPGDTLRYQTVLAETDSNRMNIHFGNFFQTIPVADDQQREKMDQFFDQFKEAFRKTELESQLTLGRNGIMEVVMRTKLPEEDNPQKNSLQDSTDRFSKMFRAMSQGVKLRGSLTPEGEIHSFWLQTNQKNLLALYFELPQQAVKIGDTWPLDVQLIQNDHNFICDSSLKVNQVRLIDILEKEGERIAFLKYQIEEFVEGSFVSPMGNGKATPTRMHMQYQGLGKFLIDQGRWQVYNGLMNFQAEGIMQADIQQEFSLVEE